MTESLNKEASRPARAAPEKRYRDDRDDTVEEARMGGNN